MAEQLQHQADALKTAEPYLQTACDLAARPAASHDVVLRCEQMTAAHDALFRAYENAYQCLEVPREMAEATTRFSEVFGRVGERAAEITAAEATRASPTTGPAETPPD